STTPVVNAGSGSSTVPVSANVTGLSSGKTYHFQLVATNGTGTTYGGDETVTTIYPYPAAVEASGPVSYWRLGDQSGTTAVDQQGVNPGTYIGGYTLGQPGAAIGDPNTSVTFDGKTGYLNVPFSATLNPSTSWSVEAWVYPTAFSTANDMTVVGSRTQSTNGHLGYELGLVDSSGQPYVVVGGGSTFGALVAGNALPLNTWSYLVATYTGGEVSLFVDGAIVGGPSTLAYSPNSTVPLTIGSLAGISQWYPGRVGEVAIYASALSATTIANHYSVAGYSQAGNSHHAIVAARALRQARPAKVMSGIPR
ncbi:MAG TPA: LamG domain-containing protein, partial [Solirubrobacteraceae bacterium]|nr:LamG domain-containing protein [Solirubrobacteraceae bacterium]